MEIHIHLCQKKKKKEIHIHIGIFILSLMGSMSWSAFQHLDIMSGVGPKSERYTVLVINKARSTIAWLNYNIKHMI